MQLMYREIVLPFVYLCSSRSLLWIGITHTLYPVHNTYRILHVLRDTKIHTAGCSRAKGLVAINEAYYYYTVAVNSQTARNNEKGKANEEARVLSDNNEECRNSRR